MPMLGDLHFDRLEHHDFEWLKTSHAGDISQIYRYSQVTTESSGKLLALAKQRVSQAQAPVPFVLQLGDMVEGLCGSPELARRQVSEALEWVGKAALGAPLAFCKGNHDVTGPGAKEGYDSMMVPFLNRQLGNVNGAAFTRSAGDTLIVFFDAYNKGSLAWFEQLMAEKPPRRLVFVIHPPVVPYNARSNWHVFAKQPPDRERLLNLLGRHRAVVFCGHLHKYSCVVRRTETGKFVQLAISSVATDPQAEPKDERHSLEAYNGDLVHLEPHHSPETVDERRALLEAEQPFIERFEYADTWGHARLRFTRDSVEADVCRGLSSDTWRSLKLSDWTV
ncbi:MAG: metallophosphoesterase [Verrucomicrobiaceae bacterium]|nr:metallophosphoesterase [Verrucomicrobiaceae bacterium]